MSDQQVEPEAVPQRAQPAPPGAIPPSPIPTSVDIGTAQMGDRKSIVMSVSTPLGVQHYFFDSDNVQALGRALMKAGRDVQAWESVMSKKLIVPGKG